MLIIRNLKKTITIKKGIFDISLSLPAGTITAVIGPNGAGKSTLFNSLNGLLSPQQGRCLLDGIPLTRVSLSQTGFLPEADFLIDRFTVLQMIDYMVSMKKQDISSDEIELLLSGFSLTEHKNTVISNLSQGMKKRVSIICAVIGYPQIIVLNEPLNALDIQSVLFLKKILFESKNHGCHVLISSHVLDFLDGLVDRVVS